MIHKVINYLIALLLFLLTPIAQSALIVDTGQPVLCDYQCGGGRLDQNNFNAAKFAISSNTILTGAEAWISTYPLFTDGDTFTIAIYSDSGNLPDASNELYSQTVNLYDSGFTDGFSEWQGLSGLDWALPSGDYWLALEVREGQTYGGMMPNNTFGPPYPLENYALYRDVWGYWYNGSEYARSQGDTYIGFGLKITGEVSAVPIPSALILFLSGLSLFPLIRKQNK